LKALRGLRDAGIAAGMFAMPILPGLTDSDAHLDAMAHAASEAGAQWFLAAPLFLMPSSARHFLPFVEKNFPRLAKRYREWYSRAAYPPEDYRKEISEKVSALRRKYGLGSSPSQSNPGPPPPQLSLELRHSPVANCAVRNC
jgi:DNA repair photolyase